MTKPPVRSVVRSMQCHDSRVPTSLTFSEHLAALESSGTRLAELAVEAGMDAPVPTCPTWEIGPWWPTRRWSTGGRRLTCAATI